MFPLSEVIRDRSAGPGWVLTVPHRPGYPSQGHAWTHDSPSRQGPSLLPLLPVRRQVRPPRVPRVPSAPPHALARAAARRVARVKRICSTSESNVSHTRHWPGVQPARPSRCGTERRGGEAAWHGMAVPYRRCSCALSAIAQLHPSPEWTGEPPRRFMPAVTAAHCGLRPAVQRRTFWCCGRGRPRP